MLPLCLLILSQPQRKVLGSFEQKLIQAMAGFGSNGGSGLGGTGTVSDPVNPFLAAASV